MATKRGPTKGPRILILLPFGRDKTSGNKPASRYIKMKQDAAKALGFEVVKKVPTKTVRFKTARGTASATRTIDGSYRRKSVKLIFKAPKTLGGKRYDSVSMPVPSGVTLDDIIKYFWTGPGKAVGVVALVSPHGKKTQWAESDTKAA